MELKIAQIHQKWRLIVGVSGGLDSVVLLDLLAGSARFELIIAHVNHNWRGLESDGDEELVRTLALKYQCPFFSIKLDPPPKSEDEARKQRYHFLEDLRQSEKADFIALAHHLDDKVETAFLHLARGTRTLSPLLSFSEHKWRPLLSYRKADLLQYANEKSLKWREDSSNQNDKFARNLIRNQILPQFEKINSQFVPHFHDFIDFHANLVQKFQFDAQNWLSKHPLPFKRKDFLELTEIEQQQVLKLLNKSASSLHLEEIQLMINKGDGKKEKHGFALIGGMVSYQKAEKKLVLASASPARQKILQQAHYDFQVIPSEAEEVWYEDWSVAQNVENIAKLKAQAVATRYPEKIILACDTVVYHPQFGVYGKPQDPNEAAKMFLSYSEQKVEVWSGFCIQNGNQLFLGKELSIINFAEISKSEVESFVASGDWRGRSGGFALSGSISRFILGIEGSVENIVGLPIQAVYTILKNFNL
ncbi:MAG TPA: tRNA lysidine(34) synthetase TilS [Candidatus Gracilibacteria bacterium]|nr:tRNA lysidine(34) synthetase TilS [Candidatus Gracilibacteria bacterium]